MKEIKHGTANAYGYHKCRCATCTEAHAQLDKARR